MCLSAFTGWTRATRVRRGGTGLGLAIVKHVAEVHQAQLKLESKPQEGTTVSVLFH